MKLYQKVIVYSSVIAGLLGCDEISRPVYEPIQPNKPEYGSILPPPHFAKVPMVHGTGMAISSGDFDGDEDLDLIVGAKSTGNNAGRIYLLRNQNGEFSEPSNIVTVPMVHETGMAISSGDFDGDGDLDLIVGAKFPGEIEGRIYHFLNDGKGNFTLKEPNKK